MELLRKLEILSAAAKYDVSCSSSGAPARDSQGKTGVGNTTQMGVCHSFTPDGRCISLLKVLMTNYCVYDCRYCINRRSGNQPRARFKVEELVSLTLDFYRRNYIEGLFLSSGIIRSSDYTMELLVRVARCLREDHQFRGYIHLKSIPDADPGLIAEAGRWADRLSVNIELPTEASIARLAPDKKVVTIRRAMGHIRANIEARAHERRAPRFAPAGQSTQMIVGADETDDHTILNTAETLYGAYRLRRVYYSAFSPIPAGPSGLPLKAPPLVREHRLYQADFLVRGYGFSIKELLPEPGNLALDVDPKLAWALANRSLFPVDVNRAEEWLVARVPGIGVRNAKRIVSLRRARRLRFEDLVRLRCPMKKLAPFVQTADYFPRKDGQPSEVLRRNLVERQLSLFADPVI